MPVAESPTPSSTDPSQVYPLKNISPSGNVPKNRLTDASKAQAIFFTVRDANRLRNLRGTYIQGMFDGNPPYQPSKLRANGQGWRANFNRLEGKSRKDAAKTPFYDLFSTAPLVADIQTKVPGMRLTAAEASGVMAEEFDEMLREWPGFDFNIWQMLDCFVGFGRGFLWFPRMDSWHFKRIPWFRVMFPDGTGVDTEDWSLFVIEHHFDLTTLNGYIKDEALARDSGWNVKQVREAIRVAIPDQANATADDTMKVQAAIRDQDIYITTRSSTVQAASVFVKEFSGKWSRMIVQTDLGSSRYQIKPDQWLYSKHEVADTLEQLLSPFFFEVENGSVNGLGGLGRDIFDLVKVGDRLACETANNAFLRSTVLLQAQNSNSVLKTGLIQVSGGVTVIPSGVNVQQATILGDVEGNINYQRELSQTLDVNTGIYRPSMEKSPGNPQTATEATLRFQQATILTSSAVNRFYSQLDKLYKEVFRRASQQHQDSSDPGITSAIAFQMRCFLRGVSPEQMRGVSSVRAMRSSGNGSPAMRAQMTAEMAAIVPQLGQRGQQAWRADFIAARGGQGKVERYMPPEDKADLPSEQDREAMQENGQVKIGNPVVIVENDNHEVHLRRHFEAAFGALTAVQQGGPPEEAAAFITGIKPHIEEHIALLPFEETQREAQESLKVLDEQYSKLLAMIQENQPDPAAQERVLTENELKVQKHQVDMAIKRDKWETTKRDKDLRREHGIETTNAKTAATISQGNAKTRAQINLDATKTKADVALAAIKTASDVEIGKVKAQAAAKPKSTPKK